MADCNNRFFGKWSVEYLDETQFSGELEIRSIGGGIVILGTILKNGVLDGTYSGFDVDCPSDEDDMELGFRLATGHTGRMFLSLSGVDFGDSIIDGRYLDDGGGDEGRIRLRP